MTWQTGGVIVGVLGVLYGLAVAFVGPRLDPQSRNRLTNWGAIALLVVAIPLFFIPFLSGAD